MKRTGVFASHPFMKLVYWDDPEMRNVDPMHTGGGEAKSVCEMVTGGTGRPGMYSTATRLGQLAKYECDVNGRWHNSLGAFLQMLQGQH